MVLSAEEVLNKFKDRFKDKILEYEIQEREEGYLRKVKQRKLWMKINKETFREAIELLASIFPPHVSTPLNHIEHENELELIYFFTLYGGVGNLSDLPVVFRVMTPKDDLRLPSVTDLIPGIILLEREAKEMLGIQYTNLPDGRRFFTPPHLDEIEEGMLPSRNDMGYDYDSFYLKRRKKGEEE
jgi:membrane-bound hydrogenase subunit beta